MIVLRRGNERRHVHQRKNQSWLTFGPDDPLCASGKAFAAIVSFSEIRLAPRGTVTAEPYEKTEIVTYVHRGTLAQQDSTGRIQLIRAGDFQSMIPSSRFRQYETNASGTDEAHIYRLSLQTSRCAHQNASQEAHFSVAERRNRRRIVSSPDGRDESLRIENDAFIYSSLLDCGNHMIHELLPGRSAWLHLINGEVTLNEIVLTQGDGIGITNERSVSLTVRESSEILLIDLGPAPCERAGVVVQNENR